MMQQSTQRYDRLAIGAAMVTVVLWASAFVGIRAAAVDFSPGSIAVARLTIGAVALGALLAMRGWRPPTRRELVLVVASGVLWFALYNVALNEAERNVDAGTASMLVNTGPIFIALLAGLFLGEGLPARLLAGCAVAFVGTLIIGLATSGSPAASGNAGWGIALCLVAALAYAGGVTLQKPALRGLPALEVTWLACLTGAVVCLPFTPSLVSELGRSMAVNVAWLVYLGLFPTAVAFTTWAFALGRTTAGGLGSMTYLVPPVVILISWLLLAEVPTPPAILGGMLCIGGVIVARSTSRPWTRRRSGLPAGEGATE